MVRKPRDALTTVEKNSLGFKVLSDTDQEVIKAYKLQFDLGTDYHNRRDLLLLNRDESITLPIPATFISIREQVIEAAHVGPNYVERMRTSKFIKLLVEIARVMK